MFTNLMEPCARQPRLVPLRNGALVHEEAVELPSVPGEVFAIGRAPHCALTLLDPQHKGEPRIHRQHAVIRVGEAGALTLVLVGKGYSTFVNGIALYHVALPWQTHVQPPVQLADRDLLRFGGLADEGYAAFVYILSAPDAAAPDRVAQPLFAAPPLLSKQPKHRADERHADFARFIVDQLLATAEEGGRVLDVAGGQGQLSAALNDLGIRCALIDPYAVTGRANAGHPEHDSAHVDVPNMDMRVSSSDQLLIVRQSFESALEHDASLVADSAALVGLHPDEVTEPIVDAALASSKPFAVIPCCAFTKLSHKRPRRSTRVSSGGHSSSREFGAFVAYLMDKDPRMRRARLPFSGRSDVLYMTSQDYLRPRVPTTCADFTPCTQAARRGDLELLQKLRSEGHPWSEELGEAAALTGHCEVLRWAYAQGCPWDWDAVVQVATLANRKEIVAWAQLERATARLASSVL